MRSIILFVLIVGTAPAQKPPPKKPADPPPLPKKAADELKTITAKIKEVPDDVEELKPGEFVKTKLVAKDVRFTPTASQYADKPIAAIVRWDSHTQQSKIYPTKATAEKATEWLEPGKVAGSKNFFTKPVSFKATYYYVENKWELGDISWAHEFGGGAISKGHKTLWTAATGDAIKPKDEKK